MIDWIFGGEKDSPFAFHEIEYFGGEDPSLRQPDVIIQEDKYFSILEEGCIWCGCEDFLRGPEGGLSVNVKCDGCGSRFNVMMPMDGKSLAVPIDYEDIVKKIDHEEQVS
jgi:hypothetical protein